MQLISIEENTNGSSLGDVHWIKRENKDWEALAMRCLLEIRCVSVCVNLLSES